MTDDYVGRLCRLNVQSTLTMHAQAFESTSQPRRGKEGAEGGRGVLVVAQGLRVTTCAIGF